MPSDSRHADLTRLARQEAVDLGQEYVGTEHLLLALAKMDYRPVGKAMASVGMRYDEIRREVERVLVSQLKGLDLSEAPLVPRVKRAMDRATARQGGEATPEDVLIELLEDSDTVAYQLTMNRGVEPSVLASVVRQWKA